MQNNVKDRVAEFVRRTDGIVGRDIAHTIAALKNGLITEECLLKGNLNDSDLQELGISALSRKALLAAIEKVRIFCIPN